MSKVVFIRHGEPIKTDEHHSQWPITEADEIGAKEKYSGMRFDYYLCSTLNRAKQTAKAAFPENDKEFIYSKLFDEIEKPLENEALFFDRVCAAISSIRTRFKGDTVVFCHSRFMNLAYYELKGKPALGFDYLESFEHEF